MEFDVRADISVVTAALNELQQSGIAKAASRGINKTLVTVNAQAARDIKQDIGGKLSISDIKASLSVYKATMKVLYVAVQAKGKRLPIIKLDPGASQDGTGVNYKMGKGRGHIDHAFIATVKTGHRGVFKRKTRSRLPIQELYGPSLPKVFANYTILQAMQKTAESRWPTVFQQEINYELSKLK